MQVSATLFYWSFAIQVAEELAFTGETCRQDVRTTNLNSQGSLQSEALRSYAEVQV